MLEENSQIFGVMHRTLITVKGVISAKTGIQKNWLQGQARNDKTYKAYAVLYRI
jgi:hypothetical protein